MNAHHRHFCDRECGAYYYCSRPDGCDRDDWTCPQCLDDEMAEALTAQELQQQQERTQEHGDRR